MPHNDYSAREKMINFSRRFDRSVDSYFARRASQSVAEPPSDPSDIATSSSDETATTNSTNRSSLFSPPPLPPRNNNSRGKHLSFSTSTNYSNRADTYTTPSPSDPITPGSPTTDPSSPTTSSSLSPQYALRPPLEHRAHSRVTSNLPQNRLNNFMNPLGPNSIRPNSTSSVPSPNSNSNSRNSAADFLLPDLPWLCGTWHVVSSSLPMWRNKRNVRITYTRLPGDRLDDHVTYQTLDSDAIVSVRGIDTSKRDGSYVWRGQGFLKVASSRWEVLGWGGGGQGATPAGRAITSPNPDSTSADAVAEGAAADAAAKQADEAAEQWVVTYFARTLFTPGGIDIYSRKASGLSPRTMKKLRTALTRVGATGKGGGRSVFGGSGQQVEFQRIAAELFEVRRDESRRDGMGLEWRNLSEEGLDRLVGA